MAKTTQRERSLVLIKPDGVQRSLIGELIQRYERTGLKLVALKFLIPQPEQVKAHYLVDDKWIEKVGRKAIQSYEEKGIEPPVKDPVKQGEKVLRRCVNYLTSGPVVAMIWEGNKAVGVVKKITGGTEPLSSDVGTIRGDFTIDSYDVADIDDRSIRNLIHCSGHPDEAEKEIKVWFSEEEILRYNLLQEKILYDVNLDGIKE